MPDMAGRATVDDINPARSFCDQTDGSPTFDGTTVVLGYTPTSGKYTLTAPLFCNKLTISGTAEVWAHQYTVDCYHLSVASGAALTWDGNDAAAGVQGATIAAGGQTFSASGGGAVGVAITGVGTAGSGSGGDKITGSAGGAGGTAGGANTGGAGNNTAALTANQIREFRRQGWANRLRVTSATETTFGLAPNGGGGGGSGGCNTGTGSATSGAGGGAGLVGTLRVGILENYGRVTSRGGNGGDAAVTGAGVAGGGGGGAGGALHIECDKVIAEGTIDVAGGTPGAGAGTGGLVGVAGTDGLLVFLVAGRPG